MENKLNPSAVIDAMMAKDYFSQWLGVERMEEGEGYSKLRMTVRKEMCNGFEIAHGGITYSLADSCLAFASNSRGKKAVSIETSINHFHPVRTGDVLTASSKEENLTNRTALYIVSVTNQDNLQVALFKGLVYITPKDWEV